MKKILIFAAFMLLVLPSVASAQNILFIGDSFTFGGNSAVVHYRTSTVNDLNGPNAYGAAFGGVPALFKLFTDEVGLHYSVSSEMVGGKGLDYHYQHKLPLLDHAWDDVVMQSYSTLDKNNPGNPALLVRYVKLFSEAFHTHNPGVRIFLDATWSRPNLTFLPGQRWSGQPIFNMAKDVNAGYEFAAQGANVTGVISVGLAFNRAIKDDLAASDPYNGVPYRKIDLWSFDNYHASTYGYYLETLMIFGRVTKIDPLTLGRRERAIGDLGLSSVEAVALQKVAHDELITEGVSFDPEYTNVQPATASSLVQVDKNLPASKKR